MLKTYLKTAVVALTSVSLATAASAGSLAESEAEPMVEDLVIEEASPTSGAWLPIVGLLIIAAVAASGGNDSSSSSEDTQPETPLP